MHQIEYLEYDVNTQKSTIIKECRKIADRDGDYEGQVADIRFLTASPRANSDEAMAYLEEHDKHWYDNLAVQFYDYENITSKKLISLTEQERNAQQKLYALKNQKYLTTLSSEFVTCKKCHSRLNRELLAKRTDICPICHNTLQSETWQKKIKAAENKIADLSEKVKAETERLQKKAKPSKIKWLVKIEYHC